MGQGDEKMLKINFLKKNKKKMCKLKWQNWGGFFLDFSSHSCEIGRMSVMNDRN